MCLSYNTIWGNWNHAAIWQTSLSKSIKFHGKQNRHMRHYVEIMQVCKKKNGEKQLCLIVVLLSKMTFIWDGRNPLSVTGSYSQDTWHAHHVKRTLSPTKWTNRGAFICWVMEWWHLLGLIRSLVNSAKCSLLMHHVKIKSPSQFLWNEQNFLWVDLSIFTQLLLWHYCNDKKPTGYWRHYHARCRPLAHMEPGVHTMSNELILQISCNIFVAFKWILMMRSSHNISNYTTAKLSVHVWNNDLIWQNKIGTQKDILKNRIALKH